MYRSLMSRQRNTASIARPLGDPVLSDWRFVSSKVPPITYQVRFIICNKMQSGVRNFESSRIIPMRSLYLEHKQNRFRSPCLDLGRHTISGQPRWSRTQLRYSSARS